MRKTLLGLTAISLFFGACKKDDASPETYYLSKMIEIGEDSNDTTFISYNGDNTFKELSYAYTSNGEPVSYSEGAVYEGGKIVSLYEKRNGTTTTTRSFVYTAGVVTRVIYHGDINGDGLEDNRYDSLVYASGKLSEIYSMDGSNAGYVYKYLLTWEGNNVKTRSTFYKFSGTEYTSDGVSKYTYDNKPGFQKLFGSYQWLNDLSSVENLSANNITKEESYRDDVLRATYSNVYTYEGNLLKMVDSENTYPDPAYNETYKVKLEYIKK
ncbi:hypothetical protein [Chitinophaga niabensis]|uniref:Uncharacterized protein n=1 Tax=Chitinophaga niabensis TaxID=536979 RepID=A0A1N6KFX3_9BACT|nr:hypothetical protein [Chitinophaga niabensis]SIO55438.1 hypothetical protein SAMN04488055_5769 [Chitinophaga niabensis]